MPICRVCKRRYIFDDDQGYSIDLCGPMCDGIEAGRAGRERELQEARELLERYRKAREFGVGMLQGTRIYLDDDVDAFLAKTGGDDPLKPLADIAAQNSADPVLANIEQGVRDGLAKANA